MGAAENVTGADRLDEGPEDDEKDDLLTLTGLLSLSPSPPNTTPGRGRDGSAELNNVVADPIVVWGKPCRDTDWLSLSPLSPFSVGFLTMNGAGSEEPAPRPVLRFVLAASGVTDPKESGEDKSK